MKTLIKKTIPAFMVVFLTACGGDNDHGDQGNKELVYKGITEPVVLTEDNKEEVASEVIKFIKEYSVYNAFYEFEYFLYPSSTPFICDPDTGVVSKKGLSGVRNEKLTYTHKYDNCFIHYYSTRFIVDGESESSSFESESLVFGGNVYNYYRNGKTKVDMAIKGILGKVKILINEDYHEENFNYDEINDGVLSINRTNHTSIISHSSYELKYLRFREENNYDNYSNYFTEMYFIFNGGETVKFELDSFGYGYSGFSFGLKFDFYSIGLPSIGVLSDTFGSFGFCPATSEFSYDSAYKNDFSSGSMDVISGDKRLTIVYVGCGEYSVTLSDAIF